MTNGANLNEDEIDRIRDAIERLARHPHEVPGACLRGMRSTALDVLADADDGALEEMADLYPCGDVSALKALRFLCALTLTLRQAKRLAEIWGAL
jgi:hypothetical protein